MIARLMRYLNALDKGCLAEATEELDAFEKESQDSDVESEEMQWYTDYLPYERAFFNLLTGREVTQEDLPDPEPESETSGHYRGLAAVAIANGRYEEARSIISKGRKYIRSGEFLAPQLVAEEEWLDGLEGMIAVERQEPCVAVGHA